MAEVEEAKKFDLVNRLTMKKHKDSINSVLYFPPPHGKIVSSSDDGTVRIWSSKTGKCLKVLKQNGVSVFRGLIRWTRNVFLVGGATKSISAYSIRKPYRLLKKIKVEYQAHTFLKIGRDSLLVSSGARKLSVISYSKNEVVKDLENQRNRYSSTNLIKSKLFTNSFYMNTGNIDNSIKLINHKKDIVVKTIKVYQKISVFTILCFLNSKHEEMILYGGSIRGFFLLKVGTPEEEDGTIQRKRRSTTLQKEEEENSVTNIIQLQHIPTSCASLFGKIPKYLVIGDSEGYFTFFSLQQNEELNPKKIGRKRIHGGWVHCIRSIAGVKSVNLISSGQSPNRVKITRVDGLGYFEGSKRNEEFVEVDLKYRIVSLVDGVDEFVISEEEKRKIFISIRFGEDCTGFFVYRSLLM